MSSTREIAERIAYKYLDKTVGSANLQADIERALADAYEDAAAIAEGCTQDDAARDEPFRIAQTIREHAKR